jgi:hypothetical protein
MKLQFAACLFVLVSLSLEASAAAPPSPYVGQQARDIKALFPDEVIAYLAGKGMGLAKAAERNGYPGPAHVLELASQLSLTDAQPPIGRARQAESPSQQPKISRALTIRAGPRPTCLAGVSYALQTLPRPRLP